MHNCNHNCLHTDVQYCSLCGKVYCKQCGKEWSDQSEIAINPVTPYYVPLYPSYPNRPYITWYSTRNDETAI